MVALGWRRWRRGLCVELLGGPHFDYRIGLPFAGEWDEVLNTDAEAYGGSGVGNLGSVIAEESPGMPDRLQRRSTSRRWVQSGSATGLAEDCALVEVRRPLRVLLHLPVQMFPASRLEPSHALLRHRCERDPVVSEEFSVRQSSAAASHRCTE